MVEKNRHSDTRGTKTGEQCLFPALVDWFQVFGSLEGASAHIICRTPVHVLEETTLLGSRYVLDCHSTPLPNAPNLPFWQMGEPSIQPNIT